MVSLKKSSDIMRTGRRSRDQTSNATGSGENSHTSSDDDNRSNRSKSKQRLYDGIIRVGRDHQAALPAFVTPAEREPEMMKDRDLLIWSPATKLDAQEMEDFLMLAREQYGYNDEQACGLLFWHKHDVKRAMLDLPKFTPCPEEFTEEDKMLFTLAMQMHGKNFKNIRQILPHKSIPSLVKYFYTRKLPKEVENVVESTEQTEIAENGERNENAEIREITKIVEFEKPKSSKETSEQSSDTDSIEIIEIPTSSSSSSEYSSTSSPQSILGALLTKGIQDVENISRAHVNF